MNNMNMEREIDLLAIIKRVLKRWKVILLVFICGALIGGLLGYRNEQAYIKTSNEKVAESESIEEYEVGGSVNSVRNLLNAVLAEKLNYLNNSYLSKIKTRDTYRGGAVYYIETQDSAAFATNEEDDSEEANTLVNEKTEEVVYYLKKLASFEYDYEDIAKDLGLESGKYIQELVSIVSENNHVVIHTTFTNEEGALKLLEYVKAKTEEGLADAKRIYGGFNYKQVYEGVDYIYSVDSKWLTAKTTEIENIVKALDNLNKNEDTINRVIGEVTPEGKTEPSLEEIPVRTTISMSAILKNALMYGVALAMAYTLLLALYLILKGKVLSESEISSAYGLKLLGALDNKKGDIENQYSLVRGEIKTLKPTLQNIAVIGDVKEDELNSVLDGLKKDGEANYKVVTKLFDDNEARNELAKCDGAIMVTKVEESTHSRIVELLKLAKDRNVDLIGYINL